MFAILEKTILEFKPLYRYVPETADDTFVVLVTFSFSTNIVFQTEFENAINK